MSTVFTLELLQDKFGAECVELNPVTGQLRFIHEQNAVWRKLDEHGGVGQVAKVFGLSEAVVWGWVDEHEIPEMYVPFLIDRDELVSDVQLSSSGYEDPVTGECWPANWRLEPGDIPDSWLPN